MRGKSGRKGNRSRTLTSRQKALDAHRSRLKEQGKVRVEVNVRKADADIIRAVAEALGDPEREADVRAWVRRELCAGPAQSFKSLLASAPLADIDLARTRDMGRAVDI